MTDSHVTDGLRSLKLSGMADEFARQQAAPVNSELAISQRLQMMICAEQDVRADRRRKRLLADSGLNPTIAPEALDFSPARGLDRAQIEELLTCQWIRLANNATIVGPTGSGKSFLAAALGRAAIRQGLAVRYGRAHMLAEDMAVARVDGSLRKLRQQMRKCDLLIIDEFGLHELDEQAKEDLLDILEERAGVKSTIVVGQRAVAEWHDFIATPLLADAILDRMLYQSYNLKLLGESMRRRKPERAEV